MFGSRTAMSLPWCAGCRSRASTPGGSRRALKASWTKRWRSPSSIRPPSLQKKTRPTRRRIGCRQRCSKRPLRRRGNMQSFTHLYYALDSTTRTAEKLRALETYFQAAEPRDAAWALYFLSGRKIKRAVNTRSLREWVALEAGLPPWLVDESYDAVGDLAETLALLLPKPHTAVNWPLHQIVEERIAPLPYLTAARQHALVVD